MDINATVYIGTILDPDGNVVFEKLIDGRTPIRDCLLRPFINTIKDDLPELTVDDLIGAGYTFDTVHWC